MSDLESPTNPHFFQPLLPNFHSHLNIPRKFFSVYMEGKHKGNTVELRSEASEKTWNVQMESQRLTIGWKDFAVAHDLRIGDIIVFRHEGELVFHVTSLGPSCCEIQYVQYSVDHEDEQNNIRNFSTKTPESCFVAHVTDSNLRENTLFNPRKISKTWRFHEPKTPLRRFSTTESNHSESNQTMSSSSLNENRFVTLNVTPATLKHGKLYLPRSFTNVNKIEMEREKKVTLLDKNGEEWTVKLVMERRYTRFGLGSGLKEFLNAIEVKAYESFVLELIRKESLMLKFCFKVKTLL